MIIAAYKRGLRYTGDDFLMSPPDTTVGAYDLFEVKDRYVYDGMIITLPGTATTQFYGSITTPAAFGGNTLWGFFSATADDAFNSARFPRKYTFRIDPFASSAWYDEKYPANGYSWKSERVIQTASDTPSNNIYNHALHESPYLKAPDYGGSVTSYYLWFNVSATSKEGFDSPNVSLWFVWSNPHDPYDGTYVDDMVRAIASGKALDNARGYSYTDLIVNGVYAIPDHLVNLMDPPITPGENEGHIGLAPGPLMIGKFVDQENFTLPLTGNPTNGEVVSFGCPSRMFFSYPKMNGAAARMNITFSVSGRSASPSLVASSPEGAMDFSDLLTFPVYLTVSDSEIRQAFVSKMLGLAGSGVALSAGIMSGNPLTIASGAINAAGTLGSLSERPQAKGWTSGASGYLSTYDAIYVSGNVQHISGLSWWHLRQEKGEQVVGKWTGFENYADLEAIPVIEGQRYMFIRGIVPLNTNRFSGTAPGNSGIAEILNMCVQHIEQGVRLWAPPE